MSVLYDIATDLFGRPLSAIALRATFNVLAKTLSLRHDADWATFCVISPLLSLRWYEEHVLHPD